jgi:Protein of unknown function (DUF2490)
MSTCMRVLLLAGFVTCQILASTAQAADSTESWPELSAFVGLNPRTRVYLDAAYAKGKESDALSLDLAAYLDISLKPILRKERLTEDWQRSRYLWARVGYDRVLKGTSIAGADVSENRGILSLYGKAPLPGEVWLESRMRADLRWIDGDYSNRYRFRVEATREFTVRGRPVVPYLNYEWFYDTRYDGWARTLWMAGTEVTINTHFRYEVYVAGQKDHLPIDKSLAAFGLVAKWYY